MTARAALGVLLVAGVCAAPAAAWRYESGCAGLIAVDGAGDVAAGGVHFDQFANPSIAVCKVDGTTGAELWSSLVDAGTSYATISAIATDASGHVIAAAEHDGDFFVIKLDGGTGGELWRYEIADGLATSLALSGVDVIAAGGTSVGGDFDLTVVRLAGANGMQLWRTDTAMPSPFDLGHAVAVDSAGDVIATGTFHDFGDSDFVAVKLAGATGTEVWRTTIPSGTGRHVAVDGADDVFATTGSSSQVVKLAGADGTILWTHTTGGTTGCANPPLLALDGAGDAVLACGLRIGGDTVPDFAVIKVDGGTGAEVWAYVTGRSGYDAVTAVAFDASGDVFAAGLRAEQGSDMDWAVVKLASGDGRELWRQRVDGFYRPEGGFADTASAVAVLPSGDAVVGGNFTHGVPSSGAPTFLSMSALDGATGPVRGGYLVVKDAAGDPSARSLLVRTNDVSLVTSPPGSIGDPRTNGGMLRVVNPTTLETAALPLPAGPEWTGLGNPPGSRGYLYRDATGSNGPCKMVVAKSDRMKGLCLGTLGPIPFTLDEPTQGSLIVSLELGTATPQCARFGGSVLRDQGTASPGPSGRFQAANANAFAGDCP